MNRKIYKELAKKYGVTVKELKRDMQEAINHAYSQPNATAQGVKRKSSAPTVDEFISHVAGNIRNSMEQEDETETEYEGLNNPIDEPLAQMIMDLLATEGNNIFRESGSLAEFKNKPLSEICEYHFGIGLYIRNNILKEGSVLNEKFIEREITDYDSMTSFIIRTWHKKLQE